MLEWFASAQSRVRSHRVAFLDRDGVVNAHRANAYVLSRSEFRLLPGLVQTLRRLSSSGHALVVVTNQSCVNRGLLARTTLIDIMTDMVDSIHEAGVPIAGWVCCTHRPDERCMCRKPQTAMLERARAVLGFAFCDAVLFGDSQSDIEAATKVGVAGKLIERNSPTAFARAVERHIERTR